MQKKVIEVQEYQSGYKDRDDKLYLSMDDCSENEELTLVKEFTPLPTIVKSQSYLIEYNYMSDGTLQVSRINGSLDKSKESFSAIELLGVVTKCQQDILKQMSGAMTQPDILKRTLIED